MRKEGRTVVIPMHKPIKPGTLRGLLDQADLSVEEFVGALKSGACHSRIPARRRQLQRRGTADAPGSSRDESNFS